MNGKPITHTLGPWINKDNAWLVMGGEEVAKLADLSPMTASYEEAVANLNVISAAPELLAALKTLLASYGATVPGTWAHDVTAPARAAIAKAEGE